MAKRYWSGDQQPGWLARPKCVGCHRNMVGPGDRCADCRRRMRERQRRKLR
jgi:tRNA(Ile2) C34 agmatinyltransferase TiaS